jgi:hypothetical protein
MFYETQKVKNLFTGEPFSLEIPEEKMRRFEEVKKMLKSGTPMFQSEEELIRLWEFSFFPSYQELLKIFFENGYTDELMTQILKEFGIPDDFAQKLLEDEQFIENLKGWFEGITCDGERASRTLSYVYEAIAGHFSIKQHASTWKL